jgi:hypothetical protein
VIDVAGRQVREVLKEPDAANRALEAWALSRQGGAWQVQAFHNCPEQVSCDAE